LIYEKEKRMSNDKQRHKAQRHAALGLLYSARVKQPDAGWVPLTDLRDALGECEFALSVLAEVEHVKRNNYQYRITGAGVLAYEAQTL
jgi:hypothetical protein